MKPTKLLGYFQPYLIFSGGGQKTLHAKYTFATSPRALAFGSRIRTWIPFRKMYDYLYCVTMSSKRKISETPSFSWLKCEFNSSSGPGQVDTRGRLPESVFENLRRIELNASNVLRRVGLTLHSFSRTPSYNDVKKRVQPGARPKAARTAGHSWKTDLI